MIPRSELINVVGGAARLEVRGSVCAFGVFDDGRPVTANWFDLAGSIGRCFYRIADCSIEQSAAIARDTVRTHCIPNGRSPIPSGRCSRQFVSGPYRLDYDEDGSSMDLREAPESDPCAAGEVYRFAHESLGSRSLLPTQRSDWRNEQRVLQWADAIEAGLRPTIVTA
jgi:hypothetical protein